MLLFLYEYLREPPRFGIAYSALMKRWLAGLAVLIVCANSPRFESKLRDGDIIFHESLSSQSRAIQLATKSRYSHMGIVYQRNGEWFVFEAVQDPRYPVPVVFLVRSFSP